jgi:hypothetical protein
MKNRIKYYIGRILGAQYRMEYWADNGGAYMWGIIQYMADVNEMDRRDKMYIIHRRYENN